MAGRRDTGVSCSNVLFPIQSGVTVMVMLESGCQELCPLLSRKTAYLRDKHGGLGGTQISSLLFLSSAHPQPSHSHEFSWMFGLLS